MNNLWVFLIIFFLLPRVPIYAQRTQPVCYFSVVSINSELASGVDFTEDSVQGKIIVNIYNPQRKKFRIMLYKDAMRLFYYTSSVNYSRCFDFTKAEAGLYLLTVSDGTRASRKRLTVISPPSQE